MATNKKLEDIEEKLNDFNCDSSCTEDEYPLAPPPEEEETQNNGGGRETLEPKKPRPAYDIFPWLKDLHAAMRKNLRCEYSQKHLINIMDKCIQHLRSDIPNYLRFPNKSFILSKHITRLLMLFKDLNRNFDDSAEYLLRISELLAFYTQLELKHSTKFDEPKQLVANRLSLNYDLLLQGAHESYILRIFLHVKNCFNQKEVMRKIYEKYLKKSRITQKCELPDKLFVMYLVSYKLWKNLEDDKDEQMKVDDFANNFMKPKPTLRTNPIFAPFIPAYKAKSDDATRCILAENFNTNSLIQAIKKDDNIDSNEKCLGNIVDLSITDDLLLTDCVKTEDETASSFLLTKNIKLEKPEIVATIDLTLEEKIKAKEISWLEELKRKARASEPINIATRCNSVQQSNIVAVIELDDDEDDEPADVEMVTVNQEKSVTVVNSVCPESLIANTVTASDIASEKSEQNQESELDKNILPESCPSDVSKPNENCEDSTKEDLNQTENTKSKSLNEICKPEILNLNETTAVQCTSTVQPEETAEFISNLDIANEVVNSECANKNSENLMPEAMEPSTINNSPDVNSNSLIESEKQLIPENRANKDSVNINATTKETEGNAAENAGEPLQDKPCTSALVLLQDVVDNVLTNCEKSKVSLNSEVMNEDTDILMSDILQSTTPGTQVTVSNSEEKSSKKANDSTPSVSNIEDTNKNEPYIDSTEAGSCQTKKKSSSSKEEVQEDGFKISDDEDDVIKDIVRNLSTHPIIARTYQRKKKPTIPNFNILSIPPVKDSTLLDLPAFSSSSSEFNDDSRDSNSLSILEDSEQIDNSLNTYITKSSSIDDTPIAKISPSKGHTSSKHTSESNVVFSMSSNRKISLPPPREEFSLRESPVNNNVVFSTSKQVSVKKDASLHCVNKENILDDWNTSSDDHRDNLFGDDNSTSTSTSLLEIDNDEIASPTMEQFTNSDVADVANFFGKVSLPSKSSKEARIHKSKISTENISANIPSENMKSLAKSKIERLTPILNNNPKIRFDYRDSSSNSPISNVTKKKSVSFVDSPQRKTTPTIFFPKESIILEKKTYIKSSPNPNRSSEILEPSSINTYTAISFSNQHDLTPKSSLTPRISVKSTWPSPNSSPTFEDTGTWLYERTNKRKLTTPPMSLYKRANLNARLKTNPLSRFDYISAKGEYNHQVGDISQTTQYKVINEVKVKIKHLDEKIFNSVIHLERLKLKPLTSSPPVRFKRTESQKNNSSFDKYLKKKSSKAARKPVNSKSTKNKIVIEKDGKSSKISAGYASSTTEVNESNKNFILREDNLLNDEKLRKRVIIQLKNIAHFQDNKAFFKDRNIEKTHATYCRKARSLYDAKSSQNMFEFKNENDQASLANQLLKLTTRRKSESDSMPTNESTSITSKMLIQVYKKSEKITNLENIFGKSPQFNMDQKGSIVSTPVEHINASKDKCSNNNLHVLCWKEPTATCDDKESIDYFQKNINPFDDRFTSCTVPDGFSDSSQQKETICKPENVSLSDDRLEEKNINYTDLSLSIDKYDENKLIECSNFHEDEGQVFYKNDQRQNDVHIEMSIDYPTAETKNSTIGGNDSVVYNDNEVSSTTQQTKRIRTRRKTVTSEYNEISGVDVSIKKKRRKVLDREMESNSNIRDNAPTTTTIIDSSSKRRGRPKGSRNKSKLLEENQNTIDKNMEHHSTETHQKLSKEPSEDHNTNAIDLLTCPVSIPYTSLEVNRNLSESPEDLNVNANIKQTYSKSNFIQNVFVPPDIEQIIEAEDKVKFSDSKVKEQQVTIQTSLLPESEEADSAFIVS